MRTCLLCVYILSHDSASGCQYVYNENTQIRMLRKCQLSSSEPVQLFKCSHVTRASAVTAEDGTEGSVQHRRAQNNEGACSEPPVLGWSMAAVRPLVLLQLNRNSI